MRFNRFFSIQWHLTNKCDQKCKHCYIFNSDKPVDFNELNINEISLVINSFIDFCEEFECNPSLTLIGGDPLLYPYFWEVLEYIHKHGIPFSILGNPFHLNHEVCLRLASLGCLDYQMSLDGLENTHDQIRKPGSFSATLSALDMIKEARLRTVIMSTVSRMNKDEIPKLIRLVTDLEVDVYGFARYCPTNGDTEYNMEPLEYREFLEKIWDVYSSLMDRKTIFSLKDHLFKLLLYEKGLYKINCEDNLVMDGCNCGVRHMAILPNGDAYACRRFESPVGNVLKKDIKTIFLGPSMTTYRNFLNLEECKDCELLRFCRGCHAVSYGTYGSFFSKDPQCWKSTKRNT